MRFTYPIAALAACLLLLAHPAPGLAQEDAGGGAKQKLDRILSVLRNHQDEAGKPCLQAMTTVHQTEDQVSGLGQQDSNSTHPDNGADVARDVLDSDYETAEAACRPDAMRACADHPGDKTCGVLHGDPGGPPPA